MKLNGAKWEPDVGDVIVLGDVFRPSGGPALAHIHTKKTGEFGTSFLSVIQSDVGAAEWLEATFSIDELHFNEHCHWFECANAKGKPIERRCTVDVLNGVYFVSSYTEPEADDQPLVRVKVPAKREPKITKVEYNISETMFVSKVEYLDNGLAKGISFYNADESNYTLEHAIVCINIDVTQYTCPVFIIDKNNVKTDGGPVPMEPDFAVYYAGWHINEYGNMVAY